MELSNMTIGFLYRHARDWARFNGKEDPEGYANWYIRQGFKTDEDFMVGHPERYWDYLKSLD